MLTEEMKKKALDKVRKLSAEELVARFEKIGSVRLQSGGSFDLHKFMEEEMERLLGTYDDNWVEYRSYEVQVSGMNDVVEVHPSDDFPSGLAA